MAVINLLMRCADGDPPRGCPGAERCASWAAHFTTHCCGQRMPSTAATMRRNRWRWNFHARSLYGSLIAERSLREMERAGLIPSAQSERWLAFMRDAFRMLLPVIASPVCGTQRRTSEFVINGKQSKSLRDRAFGERSSASGSAAVPRSQRCDRHC